MDDDYLKDTINRSGFPLQLRVGSMVEQTSREHGWRVKYTEHAWRDAESRESGFIDLVLEDRNRTSTLVVECKRALETSWVFLVPTARVPNRSHCQAWVFCSEGAQVRYSGWHTLQVDPATPESAYCVVATSATKAPQLLENVAGGLVSSTRAFAQDEAVLSRSGPTDLRVYYNVIVTTASLKTCAFETDGVSLSDGKLDAANFLTVPYLRFRKQLAILPHSELKAHGGHADDGSVASERESTVFIVNAARMVDFLGEFEASYRDLHRYVR